MHPAHLAESATGDHERAASRLLAVIDERTLLGTSGVFLGILYEAAAYVGLRAGDADAFRRFAGLAAGEYLKFPSSGFKSRYEAMLDAARPLVSAAVGQESDRGLSPASARRRDDVTTLVSRTMQSVTHSKARAERGLALLCERGRAAAGHLYLLRGSELTHVASQGEPPPDAELREMLGAWLDDFGAESLDDQSETQVIDTGPDADTRATAAWHGLGTRGYQPVAIHASLGGQSSRIGVAALRHDDDHDSGAAAAAVGALAGLIELASALGEYFLQTGAVTASAQDGVA